MNFLLVLLLSAFRGFGDFSNLMSPSQQQELLSANSQNKKRYDNYAVYDIKTQSERQRAVFKTLTNNVENFDFWFNHEDTFHIMVNPKSASQFQDIVRMERLKTSILIPNVQSLIDEEFARQHRQTRQSFSWSRYHTLEEINHWLLGIIAEHPNCTEHFSIGTSTEGRKIHGIKISYKADNPGIFIESHIHAREWITSATVTWIINELLTSTNIRTRYFAEHFDWYIVPVLNVDGFVYSHERDRLWRKTRSQHAVTRNPDCVGVDANRNYNSHWMENGGASSNPCDYTYAGPYPFSEPETRGLANFVHSIRTKINIMLAIHSYGQFLLSPFGYTTTKPDNFEDLMLVSSAFADTVANYTYHTRYRNGSTADALYLATGNTADWAYEQGIRLSYTIELRDQGQYGFLLPSNQIIPNSEETLIGLFALLTEADHLGYMNLKYQATQKNRGFDFNNILRWPGF